MKNYDLKASLCDRRKVLGSAVRPSFAFMNGLNWGKLLNFLEFWFH